jgi:hypothetical protein
MRKLILVDLYLPKSQIQLATACKKNEKKKQDAKKGLMLNYGPNGRRQLGRTLQRLFNEAETGPLSLTRDG